MKSLAVICIAVIELILYVRPSCQHSEMDTRELVCPN
jgi:hypothetical protein